MNRRSFLRRGLAGAAAVGQRSLFALPELNPTYRPPDLPELTGVDTLSLDTETTGTHFLDDKPIGISVAYRAPELRSFYFPFGHATGNLDRETVKRWCKTELAGKNIIFANAKFDIHQLKNFDVDVEAIGVKPQDIAFAGALLDDNRISGFGLDELGVKYLGEGKLEMKGGLSNLQEMAPWDVEEYAKWDANLTYRIAEVTQPEIKHQGLETVQNLENDLIYAICHIERNGSRINVPKLEQFHDEATRYFHDCRIAIRQQYGISLNPNSGEELHKFFQKTGIPSPGYKGKKGWAGFTDANLRAIDHPVMQYILGARHAGSMLSKFLNKYIEVLRGDTIYFQLHQLKGDQEFGAVSGRFSSSGSGRSSGGYGFNVQQVVGREKQIEELGDRWIVRDLFIPDDGFSFFSADAASIEYRIFAHYAANPRILAAYAADPDTDYHSTVMELLRPIVPGWQHAPAKSIRKYVKIINFCRLYGGGAGKIAYLLGLDGMTMHIHVSPKDVEKELPETFAFLQAYDSIMPEAGHLMKQCINLARNRGWVKTILGRRARFEASDRHYSALNRCIQGSSADIAKLVLRDTYRERKTLGIHKLRQVVHDEQDGDIIDDPLAHARLQEFFDDQRVPLRVPITWNVKTGDSWGACS